MKSLKIFTPFIIAFILQTQAFAGPDNIANRARVTASSELSDQYSASGVNDGIIGIQNKGEWACKGAVTFWGEIKFPWIQLDWDQPQSINKVILYDRPELDEFSAGGTLFFSDGSQIPVSTIPNDGSSRVVEFPSKSVSWMKFVVTDGVGKDLGLSEIEVYPSPESYNDYVSWVDPFIETARGRFFFFATGSHPFGMISAAPHTRNKNQGGGGYNYNSTEVLGFSQIHDWMLSGVEIMPTTGNINPHIGEEGWKSSFSHNEEIVQPGYHRLFLKRYKTWVELTSTDRVSFYRFRYTEDGDANILTNLGGYLGNSTMTEASVNKVSNTEIEGSFVSAKRLWGGPDKVKIFFIARFSKAFNTLNGWNDTAFVNNISTWKGDDRATPINELSASNFFTSYYNAPSTGVAAKYDVKAGDSIMMKISISYTSIENARENMDRECNQWNFNKVRSDSREVWNNMLGNIDVQGGTVNQKIKFYTDLWHVLLGRHKLNDINGDYPDYTQGKIVGNRTDAQLVIRTLPKDENGNARFNFYNSDAFWLTQWNLNVLWGLAWPGVMDDFSACLIQYAENGKLLPRGPCAGGYTFIMTSCPATNLLVSSYMKGLLKKSDPQKAYQIMKWNHGPGGMLMYGEEEKHRFYTKKGWYPDNAGITLEACFQDWGLAQMAHKMGEKNDFNYFMKRSEGWKHLYRADQDLIFPKTKKGEWLHNDPLSMQGWVEANAWQATWSVSHDIPGLAKLMGGNDKLCDKLNTAFENARSTDFVFGYGDGYVSYANQPGCSNAHVFNYAGKPWLTQYWVRQVKERAYGAITPGSGYGGHDEDQGQMGGVSALMAMGLFSLTGNESVNPIYDITSPVFDEITIKLDPKYYPGKQFVIKTYNNSEKNCYIQKALLNGEVLNQFWFTHEKFKEGGLLEIWLGPEPNKNWGVSATPPLQVSNK